MKVVLYARISDLMEQLLSTQSRARVALALILNDEPHPSIWAAPWVVSDFLLPTKYRARGYFVRVFDLTVRLRRES